MEPHLLYSKCVRRPTSDRNVKLRAGLNSLAGPSLRTSFAKRSRAASARTHVKRLSAAPLTLIAGLPLRTRGASASLRRRRVCSMLADVSPLSRAALISWRAISDRVQPRSSRCRRSQVPSSDDIARHSNGKQFRRSIKCRILSRNVPAVERIVNGLPTERRGSRAMRLQRHQTILVTMETRSLRANSMWMSLPRSPICMAGTSTPYDEVMM